jgi:hypothetical protein
MLRKSSRAHRRVSPSRQVACEIGAIRQLGLQMGLSVPLVKDRPASFAPLTEVIPGEGERTLRSLSQRPKGKLLRPAAMER